MVEKRVSTTKVDTIYLWQLLYSGHGSKDCYTVSARELYNTLGYTNPIYFYNWINNAIRGYVWRKDIEYKEVERDYLLTFESALTLALVDRRAEVKAVANYAYDQLCK
ncbi:hypothetical protein CLFE_029700 [Clostridium felsineum DSM 794]|nr:hypothetical protein CLFE_029700 [Clostridium felsineum DSM 794]